MTWTEVPLQELCRPRQWRALPARDLLDAGYPVYGANGVIGYYHTFTHRDPVIAVGCRGTIGSVHITRSESFVTSNSMALDELKEDRVDLGFLAHFLQFRGFKDVVSGSSQPQLTRQGISKVAVPLPPLDEQRRIAAILDQADAVRTRRKNAAELLASLPGVMFQKLVPQDRASQVPLREFVSQGDRLNYGVVQPGKEFPGGVPLIRVSDMRSGGVDRSGLKLIDPAIEENYRRSRINGTEILVSCVGTIGRVATVGRRDIGSNIPRAITRVPIADDVMRNYVAAALQAPEVQRYLTRQVRTVAQPTLNVRDLAEAPIPAVSGEEMTRVANFGDFCKERLGVLRRAMIQDDALFATLQARAFKGGL
ncbi:restriction endonuclease subunit S [Dermacoccus abyssi]